LNNVPYIKRTKPKNPPLNEKASVEYDMKGSCSRL
jgi:hypothetical protein